MRRQVVESIATRLALGGFPVLFVLVLRWSYDKSTYDLASAAINWATYLNVLLLSGFALVPPVVARLRATRDCGAVRPEIDLEADRKLVRDHVALGRWLMALGVLAIGVQAVTIERMFPVLARAHETTLQVWYLMFAVLALAQIPLTLWLGIAQAAGQFRPALLLAGAPRAVALLLPLPAAAAGVSATVAIAGALAVVLAGQMALTLSARRALRAIDPTCLAPGDARRVIASNLNAGAVVLVGTLATVVPVTIVGHALPDRVGDANVIVSLANAIASMVVAAYFPLSLTLHAQLAAPHGLVRYAWRVTRGVAAVTLATLLALLLAAGLCQLLRLNCERALLITTALVVAGAGLRLAALAAQHVALYLRVPHINLLSVVAEAGAIIGVLWSSIHSIGILALGVALAAGGALRVVVALGIEMRLLAARMVQSKAAP